MRLQMSKICVQICWNQINVLENASLPYYLQVYNILPLIKWIFGSLLGLCLIMYIRRQNCLWKARFWKQISRSILLPFPLQISSNSFWDAIFKKVRNVSVTQKLAELWKIGSNRALLWKLCKLWWWRTFPLAAILTKTNIDKK